MWRQSYRGTEKNAAQAPGARDGTMRVCSAGHALLLLDLDGLAPVLWEEHPVPRSHPCPPTRRSSTSQVKIAQV